MMGGLPSFVTSMGAGELISLMMGISFGWGLCVKIRVNPIRRHADKLEMKLNSILEKIEARFWDAR